MTLPLQLCNNRTSALPGVNFFWPTDEPMNCTLQILDISPSQGAKISTFGSRGERNSALESYLWRPQSIRNMHDCCILGCSSAFALTDRECKWF